MACLAACTGAGSAVRHNCSADGALCIEVRADEPISYGGEVSITITVISEKDISDLSLILEYEPDVILQGIQDWEKESRDITIWEVGASWNTTYRGKPASCF
jgi:hypothetical protein